GGHRRPAGSRLRAVAGGRGGRLPPRRRGRPRGGRAGPRGSPHPGNRGSAAPGPPRGAGRGGGHPRAASAEPVMPMGETRAGAVCWRWVEVDLDRIEANVRSLTAFLAGASLLAIVKADGYGHGMVPAARRAVAGGAAMLGVTGVEEGRVLRQAGITV